MRTSLQQSLLDAGYREHFSADHHTFHSTQWLYQKKVTDNVGVKYFINVYWYDCPELEFVGWREGLQFEAQLHYREGSVVDVKFSDTDIIKIESRIDDIWSSGVLDYYDYWE